MFQDLVGTGAHLNATVKVFVTGCGLPGRVQNQCESIVLDLRRMAAPKRFIALCTLNLTCVYWLRQNRLTASRAACRLHNVSSSSGVALQQVILT